MSDDVTDDHGGVGAVAGREGEVAGSAGVAASEHNGDGLHGSVYSEDTRYRVSTKQGGYLTPVRSSERARELAARRWAIYRQSAADAVARAVAAVADAEDGERIRVARRGDVAAYGAIAGKLAERAYMDADPRSADFIRRALGADTGAPERTSGSDNGNYDNQSQAGELAELLAAYRAWKAGRVVAGSGDASEGGNRDEA